MSIVIGTAKNRCVRSPVISASEASNRFQWEDEKDLALIHSLADEYSVDNLHTVVQRYPVMPQSKRLSA